MLDPIHLAMDLAHCRGSVQAEGGASEPEVAQVQKGRQKVKSSKMTTEHRHSSALHSSVSECGPLTMLEVFRFDVCRVSQHRLSLRNPVL